MATKDKLRKAAISVVADYMGIAAEFVVDDAFHEAAKTNSDEAIETLQHFFFAALAKQLPPDVPYIKVKEAIAKAAGIRL